MINIQFASKLRYVYLHILYYLEFWIGRKTIRIEASGNDYYIVWHNFK